MKGGVVNHFDRVMDVILSDRIEGGFVNHKKDPGGMTKYGISKAAYPEIDIEKLTLEEAKELYRTDYWEKIGGPLLPWPLCLYVMDAAVNQGVKPAVTMLQEALGVKPDGVVGLVTTTAAARRRQSDVIPVFLTARLNRYMDTKNFKDFGAGWFNRIFRLIFTPTEVNT